MAKRTKKSENSQEQDNREFFLALDMLEKERGIKKEHKLEMISQALATAGVNASFFSSTIACKSGTSSVRRIYRCTCL